MQLTTGITLSFYLYLSFFTLQGLYIIGSYMTAGHLVVSLLLSLTTAAQDMKVQLSDV
jgi:hypothetical protein